MIQIIKDNEFLEKRIKEAKHDSIDIKKWEKQYNKSIDYQKYVKKFKLPDLERKM